MGGDRDDIMLVFRTIEAEKKVQKDSCRFAVLFCTYLIFSLKKRFKRESEREGDAVGWRINFCLVKNHKRYLDI